MVRYGGLWEKVGNYPLTIATMAGVARLGISRQL